MIIMRTTIFSPEGAKEIAKCYMESATLPDYLTRRGPYILPAKTEGIYGIAIYEVDRPSKLAEAYEWIANDIVKYFGVPGFTYNISVCLEAEEALKTLGIG